MKQRYVRTGLLVIAPWIMAGFCPFVFGAKPAIASQGKDPGIVCYQVVVRSGDTLWGIAKKHGTTVERLAKSNGIRNPNAIRVGLRLTIYRKGISKERETTAGWRSQRVLASRSRSHRRMEDPMMPLDEKSAVDSSIGKVCPRLSQPLTGGVFSSRYGYRWGRMHRGIDWSCPTGTPIFAAASGVVTFAGWRSGYGWMVEVDHGGYSTRYAHNSRLLVRPGQAVTTGELLSLAGSTGRTTGPHLHFELLIQGNHVNPMNYLVNDEETVRDS